MALTKIIGDGVQGISNSSDATAITISSGELVGIGETSPSSALHVKGGAGANVGIQSTAGSHWRLGDGVGASNGQFVLYDYTNSGGRILVNAGGEVNLPSQPAFSVKPSGDQSNISNAATIVFDSEIYDVGSNFASNTFTAPVTGKYQISVRIYVQNIDSSNAYVQVNLTTSNRGYFILFDPDFGQDPVYWTISFSELVDMDANDTAVLNWYQSGGAAQADINSSSLFSGFLAC